jgi:hypothetical protein
MVITLVCGSSSNAVSKMCAMLASIGFNGFAPYVDDKGDHRFNTFVSERLSALMREIGDHPAKCKDIYAQLQRFADEVASYADALQKKRVFLCHPHVYQLIPYLKNFFELRVIFVLDAMLEPDNEVTLSEWDTYYQQRTAYLSSLVELIENQHFPYLLVNSADFFENRVGLLKRLISFQRLKMPDDANTFNKLQRDINKLSQRIAIRSKPLTKVAVITAYAKEPLETLQKCIASVKAQTVSCTHILVADGFANDVIAQQSGENLLHIALPENIGFNQCGVGVELAFALGFEAVAILDADNWYEPDHIETSLLSINDKNADVVFARRKVVFPDGEVLSVEDPQDNTGAFADTNCMVLTNKVAALTPIWLMWPKVFGAGEDRAVSICTRMLNFNVLMNPHETVWYQTNWAHHYKLQNKKPVAPLRKPTSEFARSFDQKRFFEASGFNLPIKQGGAESVADNIDFEKLGIVVINLTAKPLKSKTSASISQYHVFMVHQSDLSAPAAGGLKTLQLPKHQNFKHTAWSLGASLLFQTGSDAVMLVDDVKSLDEVNFGAMLNHAKQNSLDVILQVKEADKIPLLQAVLVTKKAKFFAAVWNQLNHISPVNRIEACEKYLNQKNIRYQVFTHEQ